MRARTRVSDCILETNPGILQTVCQDTIVSCFPPTTETMTRVIPTVQSIIKEHGGLRVLGRFAMIYFDKTS